MLDAGWMPQKAPGDFDFSLPPAFGDYEFIAELARGGMGVVYKARQRSLNRTVAVKMVLAARLARKGDLQRFRAEAETAARLQHPNIVAIHEVGEFEGQPFFSMDYVDGKSLAEIARNQPLPAKQAATYLKTIAEAIQYAHSKGVLHRDLKPSNILIDQNDQPRITDFGLAKRLDDSQLSTPDPQLTLTGQVLGSPNFMPPEQATGNREAIGPASDVYSLGAVLYQLVTGRPPFLAATVPETLRLVAEAEPAGPRLLNPTVPRDLETICLKCLEKAPQRRYSTAQELADELGRFARDEPIRARPTNQAEKIRRWCRRNPGLAGSLAGVVALLLVVGIGSPVAAFRINRERLASDEARKTALAQEAKARTEAAKSQQVAQFLKDMLAGVGPSVALGRDTTMLREILEKTRERVGTDLTNDLEVEVELLNTLSGVYAALADHEHRIQVCRQALALRKNAPVPVPADVADSMDRLGTALLQAGYMDDSVPVFQEGLNVREKAFGKGDPRVAISLERLSEVWRVANRNDQAEDCARQALALNQKAFGAGAVEVAADLQHLASALYGQRKLPEAETEIRAALSIMETAGRSETNEAMEMRAFWGRITEEAGDLEAAERIYREVVALQKRKPRQDLLQTLSHVTALAAVLEKEKKWGESEALRRELLKIEKQLRGPENHQVAARLGALGANLRAQGRLSEAEETFRESLGIRKKVVPLREPIVAFDLESLGGVLREEGKIDQAEACFREALGMERRTRQWPWGWKDLAVKLRDILRQQGKRDEADKMFNEAVEDSLTIAPDYGGLLVERGSDFARHGRWKEAAADMTNSITRQEMSPAPHYALAALLIACGEVEAYRDHCQRHISIFSARTTYPLTAARIALSWLLLPSPESQDVQTFLHWAELSVSKQPKSPLVPDFMFVEGLAAYRQGLLERAVTTLSNVVSLTETNPFLASEAHLTMAMSQWKLNQANSGRESLKRGADLITEKMATLESGDIGEAWVNWIIAHALLIEARTLIEGECQGCEYYFKAKSQTSGE
jgi:tetratricopeptide (TPR) repeat protein